MNDVYQTDLKNLDRLSVQSVSYYLTLKISYPLFSQELSNAEFLMYTKGIQKLNKVFPSIKRQHMMI